MQSKELHHKLQVQQLKWQPYGCHCIKSGGAWDVMNSLAGFTYALLDGLVMEGLM